MLNHGLRSRRQRRPRSKIDFVRRPVSQRLVWPFVVVKLEIVGKMRPRRRDRLVVVKINLLVLDGPPESLEIDAFEERRDVFADSPGADNIGVGYNLEPTTAAPQFLRKWPKMGRDICFKINKLREDEIRRLCFFTRFRNLFSFGYLGGSIVYIIPLIRHNPHLAYLFSLSPLDRIRAR